MHEEIINRFTRYLLLRKEMRRPPCRYTPLRKEMKRPLKKEVPQRPVALRDFVAFGGAEAYSEALRVPAIHAADAFVDLDAVVPAEGVELGDVGQLAQRAVGLGGVEGEAAAIADGADDELR